MTLTLRHASAYDVESMQRLAARVWPAGWHPGGLGWAAARGELADEVVVIVDDDLDGVDNVVGWAGRGGHDDTEVHAQVETGRPDVSTAIVEWALDGQGPAGCTLLVWDGAVELAMAAEAAGLRAEGRDAWSGLFLDAAPAAADPRRSVPGYRLRSMDEAEVALPERVAVHRAAWRPASLPYADGRAVDEAAESSFSSDVYATIRSTWLYDESLDVVAMTEDGHLAASCIAWYDPSSRVAEIEPLGVAPDHRRRGLAVGLCLEVAHRVVDRGGVIVYINGTPDPAYPAPSAAYLKAGFRLLPRATTYRSGGSSAR